VLRASAGPEFLGVASKIVASANGFLSSLDKGQRSKVLFEFDRYRKIAPFAAKSLITRRDEYEYAAFHSSMSRFPESIFRRISTIAVPMRRQRFLRNCHPSFPRGLPSKTARWFWSLLIARNGQQGIAEPIVQQRSPGHKACFRSGRFEFPTPGIEHSQGRKIAVGCGDVR
jgi:hypothetical protein